VVTWVMFGGKYLHTIQLSHFYIYLPKLIEIRGNLTKFWQKQKCTVFLRHGVYLVPLTLKNIVTLESR